MLPTTNRIRSILKDCQTDADVAATLRYHKVKFKYTTETGFLSVVVPCLTGSVRIVRRASKTAPFSIDSVAPVPYYRRQSYHYENA